MDSTDFRILVERVGREAEREYVVVIGAAAVMPWLPESADPLLFRTRDVDVVLDIDDADNDRIHFILGEGSPFDEMFGIYAQPVSLETPTYAPRHWVSRTLVYRVGSVTALCMEVHDLALSKYGAGRPKDLEFTRALAKGGFVREESLLERLPLVDGEKRVLELMRARIRRDFSE